MKEETSHVPANCVKQWRCSCALVQVSVGTYVHVCALVQVSVGTYVCTCVCLEKVSCSLSPEVLVWLCIRCNDEAFHQSCLRSIRNECLQPVMFEDEIQVVWDLK